MESEEFTLEKLDLHERGPLHEPSQSGCLRPSQIDGDVVSCGDVIHGPMEPITAAGMFFYLVLGRINETRSSIWSVVGGKSATPW